MKEETTLRARTGGDATPGLDAAARGFAGTGREPSTGGAGHRFARGTAAAFAVLVSGLLASGSLASASSAASAAPHPCAPLAGGEVAVAEPALLQPGRPLEAALAGGESRTYVFDLEAGRYARIEVEQRGIDVAAILRAPDGEVVIEADGPDGDHGVERASALADSAAEAGRYRLEVVSPYPEDPGGTVAVVLAEVRPAEPGDRDRLAAEQASNAAVALWAHGDAESLRAAVARFEEVLAIWRRLDDRRRQAEAATHLGYLHRSLGEINREAEYYEIALPLWRELDEPAREAELTNNLAAAYGMLGNRERARAAATEAVELFRRLGDQPGEAAALNTLGYAHLQAGHLEPADQCFERSLELSRQIGDLRQQGRVLSNQARLKHRQGRLSEAAGIYRDALDLARASRDRRTEAVTLNNLSTTYESMGELARSLEHYHEVLELVREIGDARGEAFALNNIGSLYKNLGEVEEGIAYLGQALEIFRDVEDRAAEAGALGNIGWALLALDRPEEAVRYIEESLEVARRQGDARRQTVALADLARAYHALERNHSARTLAGAALDLARAHGHRSFESTALRILGEIYTALGHPADAISPLQEAVAISRDLGSRPGEAHGLLLLARAERSLGLLDNARHHAEAAVERIESIRTAVANQDLRATYLASKQDYYEEWIGALMELDHREPEAGWAARALAVAEQARARTLLDSLTEVETEIRGALGPTLAAEEERLRHLLNAHERDRQQSETAGDAEAAAVEAKRIRALTAEYRALEAQIRNTSPHFADLVQPQPLDAETIQAQVLDPGTVLLQYSLGAERSWLWTVTPERLTAHPLPARAEIEPLARRIYALLTARNAESEGENAADRAHRIEAADAAYPAAAAELAEILLEPAAAAISAEPTLRVVVVADGALHYVPFGALPAPGTDLPLLFDHVVVNAPSASTLAVQRRELAGRPRALGTLAVIADPVFDAADSRVKHDTRRTVADNGAAAQALRSSGYGRLRFSRREAEQIADLVPADERFTALDFDASRETAIGGGLAGYRIVHFATHGVLNTDYPALSGLVLSQVDRKGEPQEGFLRLHDIYQLNLDAELVTLSACETALGREIHGEGLVGLARGFMYAGAARVVASLWRVQDRATAETMRRFYRGMLEEGLAPAAALREAQVAMARDARWSAPYYWAPFVLHGEWRSHRQSPPRPLPGAKRIGLQGG